MNVGWDRGGGRDELAGWELMAREKMWRLLSEVGDLFKEIFVNTVGNHPSIDHGRFEKASSIDRSLSEVFSK